MTVNSSNVGKHMLFSKKEIESPNVPSYMQLVCRGIDCHGIESKSSNSFIACCQNILKINLDIIPNNKNYYQFFIGPEGDFTESELNWALTNNIKPLSLGENRLRTETAGIMAVNFVNLFNN